jgi:hypothetical protein
MPILPRAGSGQFISTGKESTKRNSALKPILTTTLPSLSFLIRMRKKLNFEV